MTAYAAERPLQPAWRGLIGFNMMTALALGAGGWFLGAWIGGQMAVGKDYLLATDQNDVGILMGYLFGLIGWLGGLGFFNYPVSDRKRTRLNSSHANISYAVFCLKKQE